MCICNSQLKITDAVTIDANLNMNGVKGTISFSQASPTDPTEITVSLTGLDQYPSETFPWHIHNYPFTTQCDDPCSAASVGGHFDPFMARSISDYSTRCSNNQSLCEVGDLSGKFGRFNASTIVTVTLTDNNLSLYGVHSIMGRSVVIHRNNDVHWVCTNIDYPSDVTVAYSPFRTDLIGNIFFIEPFSPMNLTSVFVQLSYISEPVNSSMHGWHVHNNSIDGDCVDAGEHYNPKDISTGSLNYSLCNPSSQNACEVGDLAGKSSSLNFNNGHSMLFYTDTNLPVRINRLSETILGRSVVIHEKSSNPARIACANLLEYSPRIATTKFQEDGVTGQIVFKQLSPFSPTVVRIQLNGLLFKADDYHVHEFPVDKTIQGGSKCMAAGGHYNPTNITRKSSSPNTLDAYEIGNLSGKSSQTLIDFNSLDYRYTDPYLPLFGTNSIVGRAVVIRKTNGGRWLCANIIYDMDTVSITTVISNDTFQGRLVLTQLANDPFSETIILLDFNFRPPVTSSSAMETLIPTHSSTSMTKPSNVTLSTSSLTSISITSILSTTTTIFTSSVTTSPNVTSSNLTSTVLVMSTSTQSSTSMSNTSAGSLSTSSSVMSSSVITPTTSSMVDNKTTADEKPSATTTSNTAITSSTSTASTSLEVSLSMTMDIGSGFSLSSSMPTSSPTNKPGNRKKKDVFKRQTPVLYLSIQNGCEPGASVANPFSPSSSCSPTNQLACPIGDLVGKHGPLSSGRNLLTDLNLPLTGPNSSKYANISSSCPLSLLYLLLLVAGMAVAVRIGDVDSPIAGCMPLPSPTVSTASNTASGSVAAVTTTATSPTAVTLSVTNTIITSTLSTFGTPTVSGTPESQGSGGH